MHRLRKLRRLYEPGAQQRDPQEAAQEVSGDGTGSPHPDEHRRRRDVGHCSGLSAVSPSLSAFKITLREADRTIFLRAGAPYEGQGSIFPLATRRRRIVAFAMCMIHDDTIYAEYI